MRKKYGRTHSWGVVFFSLTLELLIWSVENWLGTYSRLLTHARTDTNCQTRSMWDTTVINNASFHTFSPVAYWLGVFSTSGQQYMTVIGLLSLCLYHFLHLVSLSWWKVKMEGKISSSWIPINWSATNQLRESKWSCLTTEKLTHASKDHLQSYQHDMRTLHECNPGTKSFLYFTKEMQVLCGNN